MDKLQHMCKMFSILYYDFNRLKYNKNFLTPKFLLYYYIRCQVKK